MTRCYPRGMSRQLVVAITGASAGIGRAIAYRLTRDGARVVVSARRADRLDEVVREIELRGGEALSVVADVTREEDVQRLVRLTIEHFGRLDVMIRDRGRPRRTSRRRWPAASSTRPRRSIPTGKPAAWCC